jgi:hypothetical protein
MGFGKSNRGTGYSGQIKSGTTSFSNTVLGVGLPKQFSNIYNINKVYLGYEMPNSASKRRAVNMASSPNSTFTPSTCYHLQLIDGETTDDQPCNDAYNGNQIQNSQCCPYYYSNNYSNISPWGACTFWGESPYAGGNDGPNINYQCSVNSKNGIMGYNHSYTIQINNGYNANINCSSYKLLNCENCPISSQWPGPNAGASNPSNCPY